MSSADPFVNGLRDDADWICIARDSLDALLRVLAPSYAGAATAKGEADAIRHLADKLKENPGMTREEASAECARFGKNAGFSVVFSRKLERRPVYQRERQRAANGTIEARNRSANRSAKLIAATLSPPFD